MDETSAPDGREAFEHEYGTPLPDDYAAKAIHDIRRQTWQAARARYAAPVAGTEAVAWRAGDPENGARWIYVGSLEAASDFASQLADEGFEPVIDALGVLPPTTTTDAEKQS